MLTESRNHRDSNPEKEPECEPEVEANVAYSESSVKFTNNGSLGLTS